MIIKVATSKKSDGSIEWKDPYSNAIRNRLRVDLNLSDVPDKAAARRTLGVESAIDNKVNDSLARAKEYVDDIKNTLLNKINALEEKHNNEISELRNKTSSLETQVNNDIDAKLNSAINTLNARINEFTSSLNKYDIFPVGTILPYIGNPGSISSKWHVCDGTAGTVDLRNQFIMGYGSHSAGTRLEAGLPNITGSVGAEMELYVADGCFIKGALGTANKTENWPNSATQMFFDASRSNPIYGRSNTVQPPAVVVYFIQKISA